MPNPSSTSSVEGSFPRRLTSALARSLSRSSSGSSSSCESASGFAAGEYDVSSSSCTSGSSTPPLGSTGAPPSSSGMAVPQPSPSSSSFSMSLPLSRSFSSLSSSATTALGLLSLSARADSFEERYQKEQKRVERSKRQAEVKNQRDKARKIADFHTTVQAAVFVGTVRHTDAELERRTGGIRTYVDRIAAKNPPSPGSSKAIHFETFQKYYNGSVHTEPLECFFDVFVKTVPPEGSKITFFARPVEEADDKYIAVACNLLQT